MEGSWCTCMSACYLPNSRVCSGSESEGISPSWISQPESRQVIAVDRDACSDREHLEKAPKPGWRPVLVKDCTFTFKTRVQVMQLWSFQAEGTTGREVWCQEGKWPIKATANSISRIGDTDLVEKEKEKWSWEECQKHILKDLGCHTSEFELDPGANS